MLFYNLPFGDWSCPFPVKNGIVAKESDLDKLPYPYEIVDVLDKDDFPSYGLPPNSPVFASA